jgi:putative heme iron utilization protein
MPDPAETTRQPGQPVLASQPKDFRAVSEGRSLLRRIRVGSLATLDRETGHPFASLVSVATDFDGSPLLLMSGLSAHTRNIEADPRVSLMLSQAGKGDPLAHPRLTLIGRCERDPSPVARRRFLKRHPKSALYADFGDFAFYRIAIEGGHLNGGFARAARLSAEELLTPLEGAESLLEAEPSAIDHMNEDHAEALNLYATRLLGLRSGRWRLTGLDPDGMDLILREESARLLFEDRIRSFEALIRTTKTLAEKARAITTA